MELWSTLIAFRMSLLKVFVNSSLEILVSLPITNLDNLTRVIPIHTIPFSAPPELNVGVGGAAGAGAVFLAFTTFDGTVDIVVVVNDVVDTDILDDKVDIDVNVEVFDVADNGIDVFDAKSGVADDTDKGFVDNDDDIIFGDNKEDFAGGVFLVVFVEGVTETCFLVADADAAVLICDDTPSEDDCNDIEVAAAVVDKAGGCRCVEVETTMEAFKANEEEAEEEIGKASEADDFKVCEVDETSEADEVNKGFEANEFGKADEANKADEGNIAEEGNTAGDGNSPGVGNRGVAFDGVFVSCGLFGVLFSG